MKKIINFSCIIMLLASILVGNIFALDIINENRLAFGHILDIEQISTEPFQLIPGNNGSLKMLIKNTGEKPAVDIRADLELPSGFIFYNDVSQKKITNLNPNQKKWIEYKIISDPSVSEGTYKAQLEIKYVNNVGEDRQDNYTIGLVVKSNPQVFATLEKTDIYEENLIGDVTFNFVNNDVGNIKFLTTEVKDSEKFEIISEKKKYIGDLDSADYQTVIYRLKVKKDIKKIIVPIALSYKDSLNNDYHQNVFVEVYIRNAQEMGIKRSFSYWYFGIFIILLIGIFVYRRLVILKKRK